MWLHALSSVPFSKCSSLNRSTCSNSVRKRRPNQTTPPSSDNEIRGWIVETITKWLHEFPGVRVEHDVWVPTSDGKSQRQIDVLLIFDGMEDEEQYIVIECKNYGRNIEVGLIDCFVGMLRDIGVPYDRGIYVCVEGYTYTKDARRRANREGIKLLKLGGLTKDRLKQQVLLALQSVVYVMADFDEYRVAYDEPEQIEQPDRERVVSLEESLVFYDHEGRVGNMCDFLWKAWNTGTLQPVIGTHHILLELPPDSFSIKDGAEMPVTIATCTVEVRGYIHTLTGTAHQHTLINVEDGTLDKFGAQLSFDRPQGTHVLKQVTSERELQDFVTGQRITHVLHRVKVPRIRFWHMAYWPQSQRAGQIVRERMHAFFEGRAPDPRPFIWTELEGPDIAMAWEPIDQAYLEHKPANAMPVKLQDFCVPE
jgi:Restriction endonuclease